MTEPLLLVTGFGSFERVELNPSGRLALALAADPPAGCRVHARELPVSFRRSAEELDRALAELEPRVPAALLALGVQQAATFRLERRARARMKDGRPDNDGVAGEELGLAAAPDLTTTLDLVGLEGALRAAGARAVEVSDDAGGYVCERVYRHVLEVGERLGVPALFLHVPPAEALVVDAQLPVAQACLAELARQVVQSRALANDGMRP